MKKSELLALLQSVKSGNVKIDDAITKAETSRASLIWESCQKNERPVAGFLYKVNSNGLMAKLPEKRDGKVFQPYYRSLASAQKLAEKAKAKKAAKV